MKHFSIILAVLFLFSVQLSAQDAKPEFIGTGKCKLCHKGEKKGMVYEKWMESKHANAFQTLVAKGDGSEKKPECLSCHTTGFGQPGGYAIGAEKAADFEAVGCESCHGAGSLYKKDHGKDLAAGVAAGLNPTPTAETCKACHNEKSPTFKGFEWDKYHAEIEHKFREKAGE